MSAEARAFTRALLDGDRRRAEALARAGLPQGVPHVLERIVQPALYEIGALWERNQISVADEHAATALAQSVVALLYPEFPWPQGAPRCLVSCAPGERHAFGARMVADLLALDGWDVRFLGADTAAPELGHRCAELAPRLVGLSASLPLHLPLLREAIAAVRRGAPLARILVGGRAVSGLAAPGGGGAAAIGADLLATSASDAVRLARPLRG